MYRRFIPNFARVAAPLTELLKKEVGPPVPQFSEGQLAAFGLLKKALVSPPVLRLPRQCRLYSVDTDVCDHKNGCVLFQTHEDGKRCPVGFWSRQLHPAEKTYSAARKNAWPSYELFISSIRIFE